MSTQLNAIRHPYILVAEDGTFIEGRNDRYPIVSKAIQMKKRGEKFEIRRWDKSTQDYKWDEIGMSQVENRPPAKGRESAPTQVNTDLVRKLQALAEASRAMASMVRQGEDVEGPTRDLATLCQEVFEASGSNFRIRVPRGETANA